jgi:hypothetical protein
LPDSKKQITRGSRDFTDFYRYKTDAVNWDLTVAWRLLSPSEQFHFRNEKRAVVFEIQKRKKRTAKRTPSHRGRAKNENLF